MAKKRKKALAHSARIGIINRGEAAVRFIHAVKQYNARYAHELSTVVFYLDMEDEAVFVQEADVACSLSELAGFCALTGSPYLNKNFMIKALQSTGCQAVWVGWGFLAEDAAFVEMIENSGLVFLGPSAKAMGVLGDKIAAKDLAKRTHVPILPWSEGPVGDLQHAQKIAAGIGYPLIVKASNAGGGRGIRVVKNPDELKRQYYLAKEETMRITGNDIVFIEHLVQKARHLEVQVLADRHGNVQTFGVRDCSVQRRNQKIMEETPPPGIGEKTTLEMEESAARLIRAADYESAGTVEFLYDLTTNKFYFMEVNTRLQVEHPITELLYNIDFVKAQIQVAMGEPLGEKYAPRGVAIEVRLNAEDPDNDFIPAPGKVTLYKTPSGSGIRVDSGVEEGSVIPHEFDSMIAKIIAYSCDREDTLACLLRALKKFRIKVEGGTTNRAFLLELLNRRQIRRGGVHTRFVEELLAGQDQIIYREDWDIALIACAIEQYANCYFEELVNFKQQFTSIGHPRDIPPSRGCEITLNLRGHRYSFLVKAVGNGFFHLEINGKLVRVRYLWRGHQVILIHRDKHYDIQMVSRGDMLQCEINGIPYPLQLEPCGVIKAPSPAIVISIAVLPGQVVNEGDLLITLEVMKMEIIVVAPQGGVVKSFTVKKGEQVAAGQSLLYLESAGQKEAGKNVGSKISFERLQVDELSFRWEVMECEFMAVFLGYDHPQNHSSILSKMLKVADQLSFKASLGKVFLAALQVYVAVENLFSQEQIQAEGFARAVSYQELLMHFFKRKANKKKGLPKRFLCSLERAVGWYRLDRLGKDEAYSRALFRIYKSHVDLKQKQDLLRSILFAMEDVFTENNEPPQSMADVLDEIVQLSQIQIPSLADAALHVRYSFFDRVFLEKIKKEKRCMIAKLLELIAKTNDRQRSGKQIESILDSGRHIVFDLVKMGLDVDKNRRKLAVELLAKRFNRDRKFISGEAIEIGDLCLYLLQSANKKERNTLVAVIDEQNFCLKTAKIRNILSERSFATSPEAILLVSAKNIAKEEELLQCLQREKLPVHWCCLGLFFQDGSFSYKTFMADGKEDVLRRSFSPLSFRELRVYRLVNFDLKILDSTEFIYLVLATAKSDPKDERLIALVKVPETHLEFNEDDSIHRIVAFEHAFMEALYAMRAAQARRKRRLFWNRIVIHVRSRLQTNLKQIEDYASRLAPRVMGLGLEKVVLYARRQGNVKNPPQEMEFLFENISGCQYELHCRIPSSKILEPMDKYVSKVIRARQRGTVYPYEIIKMITRRGYCGNEKFPRGNFEEFDIDVDPKTGAQRTISVNKRPYGNNIGNIVIGVITNYNSSHPYGLKRVLILADPTSDMGALAEDECRRIIAALEMARNWKLPVEWVPISAGARIDMNSGTENLDWTAKVVKAIVEFTQAGGEINIIVSGTNVGAQSYWNAEATMLMHTKGLLIMTDEATMLLTGKKALDFSGSISAEDNLGIGGERRIMGPNGESQMRAKNLSEAYWVIFRHYDFTYLPPAKIFPEHRPTKDPLDRDICKSPYQDRLEQGFSSIGDIFSQRQNPERKKPFEMRQVMKSVIDRDFGFLQRWETMKDAETAIVWETRIGGYATGLIGIESRPLARMGAIPNDGPKSWSGGTLFPQSSKKVASAINAFNQRLPLVVLANLSGFDGSPESLRKRQLEFGAEIGRAVVNFRGPIIFVVVARYHGGAYVVFSRALNPLLTAVALEGTYASVIGGAPAASVVFPRAVLKDANSDPRIIKARRRLKEDKNYSQNRLNDLFQKVHAEKQTALAQRFDRIHSVERAKEVGSIDDIIPPYLLRPYLIRAIEVGMDKCLNQSRERAIM